MTPPRLPIAVLISGNGSNLQAIIDAIQTGLPVEIQAVISNQPEAFGLTRAEKAGIPTHVIPHRAYGTREAFEDALDACLKHYAPTLIVLAGFMRRLTAPFVARHLGAMINIHPSLLPKYPGLDTHARALAAQDTHHGASIHFVTPEVDGGPIICQSTLDIAPDDTPGTLQKRVQVLEHVMYPQVLDWFAHGRLRLADGAVLFDNRPLPPEGVQLDTL